ncbi:hypothetical protein D3C85_1069700 [compost metagenome]
MRSTRMPSRSSWSRTGFTLPYCSCCLSYQGISLANWLSTCRPSEVSNSRVAAWCSISTATWLAMAVCVHWSPSTVSASRVLVSAVFTRLKRRPAASPDRLAKPSSKASSRLIGRIIRLLEWLCAGRRRDRRVSSLGCGFPDVQSGTGSNCISTVRAHTRRWHR